MNKEQVEKIAIEDAIVNCSKLKGYSNLEQLVYKRAFISGYKQCANQMFTERELMKAMADAIALNLTFQDVEPYIEKFKKLKASNNEKNN